MSMPGCISRPSPYGDVRAPKGEVTSPRTGQSVGTPRLTSSPRSFTSTVSTANESLAVAACPSSQASCSSARPASSDTTDMPPSSIAATLTSGRVSARLSSMCARRRASAPRSPSADVVRARRSTPRATWAISRRWRAISSRLSASRVRSPATSSRSAALRCSACHTCLAAAAPMTTTSAAARREPCAAREMTGASGMKDLLEVGSYPATRPLCCLSIPGCGPLALRRSCSACSRTSCVRRSPPSMRASSATRSLVASGRAVDTVRPSSTFLVTTTWWSAKAAISGRWVMQRTWRLRPSWRSLRPTTSATAPPIPASTSSKMRVAPRSSAAARVLSASMMRDSSPPEATRASERGSSPGFVERKNSTSSQPSGPSARPSVSAKRTSKRAPVSASASSSAASARDRSRATRRRSIESRPAHLAERDERAAEHVDHRALAGVEALLGARRQHGQALGVHQAGTLDRERFLLARHECGARQLLGLRAQHLGPLARGLGVGVRRRDRLARRDQAAVAGAHLLERAPEAAHRVEQLAVALDAPESLVLVLPVHAQEVGRQLAQQGERAEGAVHVGARAAAARDHAADEELVLPVLGRDAGTDEPLAHLSGDVHEEGLDRRLLGPGAHQVRVRPSAERHVERLEEDRLPRAGLAGDDVEPGLEHQLELLNERQVADAERAQHARPLPYRTPQPSLERSTS